MIFYNLVLEAWVISAHVPAASYAISDAASDLFLLGKQNSVEHYFEASRLVAQHDLINSLTLSLLLIHPECKWEKSVKFYGHTCLYDYIQDVQKSQKM